MDSGMVTLRDGSFGKGRTDFYDRTGKLVAREMNGKTYDARGRLAAPDLQGLRVLGQTIGR